MRFARSRFFLLLIAALMPGWSTDAGIIEPDGTLDLTFDAGKITKGDVYACAIQADGKLLIAGLFGQVNGVARRNIARLNPDGSLDPGFDTGTGPSSIVTQILLQADGKIIIAGSFGSVAGTTRAGIARLNADGSLDAGYNPAAALREPFTNSPSVSSLVLQSNDKAVVAGFFSAVAGAGGSELSHSCVTRFNIDGTVDSTFNVGTGFRNGQTSSLPEARSVARLTGDKLVVGGNFDDVDGHSAPGVARLNSDGSYDGTFNATTTSPARTVTDVFAQANDQVLILGDFTSAGAAKRPGVARLTANGSLDTNFQPCAFLNYTDPSIIYGVAQQADGKLIFAGSFHSVSGAAANGFARLNTDGTLDTSFSTTAGTGPNGQGLCVAIRDTDSRIFVGGSFAAFAGIHRENIALANPDGGANSTFAPSPGATDGSTQIYALATQSDGRIIAGGIFSSVAGAARYNLVRFDADGSVDESFAVGQGVNGSVRAIRVLPNDKILIGGFFTAINGQVARRFARLNADGSLDPSFDIGANGPDSTVYAITLDAQENVFIGGTFENVGTEVRHQSAKFNSDGVLDPDYDPIFGPNPTGSSDQVFALAPPTGAAGLVIAGNFTSYDFQSRRRIVRVNATTAVLEPFTQGNGFNSTVFALAPAAGGKYLVGGSFSQYHNVTRSRLALLNSDGTADASFVPTGGPSGSVRALAMQGSKIFSGGSQIARFLQTGAFDPSFTTGSGVTISPAGPGSVYTLALESGGKLLIGGSFDQYNGVTRFGIARLTGPTLEITSITRDVSAAIVLSGTGAPNRTYNLEATAALGVDPFLAIGTVQTDASGIFQVSDPDSGSFSKRFYRLGIP